MNILKLGCTSTPLHLALIIFLLYTFIIMIISDLSYPKWLSSGSGIKEWSGSLITLQQGWSALRRFSYSHISYEFCNPSLDWSELSSDELEYYCNIFYKIGIAGQLLIIFDLGCLFTTVVWIIISWVSLYTSLPSKAVISCSILSPILKSVGFIMYSEVVGVTIISDCSDESICGEIGVRISLGLTIGIWLVWIYWLVVIRNHRGKEYGWVEY
jgi:hypothetical protein